MRAPTALAAAAVLAGLGAVVVLAVGGGVGPDGGLTERWVSDSAGARAVNHHAPAAGTVGGDGVVFAPVSGARGTDQCALVALHATNGSERWRYPVPPDKCTIHSVADPTLADYDDDGVPEVFVTTTEEAVIGFHPLDGAVELRHDLTAYGYTRPIVADLTGDGDREVITVDVQGSVAVLRADGTPVWTRQFSTYTWGQPAVSDFDGDGEAELLVGFGGSGELTLFEADGTVAWNRSRPGDGSITWLATGQLDDDPAEEAVVATSDGVVAVVDGRDGSVTWRRDLGTLAAVHGVGDGDGDGEAEVYAVAKDAVLRSYSADTGEVEWSTTLTTDPVQMTPPPSLGDLDGDGTPELVAVTNDGVVSIVDPATGDVVDTYRRGGSLLSSGRQGVPIWVHPTLADVDGEGGAEVFVMYGDGRVAALSYSG